MNGKYDGGDPNITGCKYLHGCSNIQHCHKASLTMFYSIILTDINNKNTNNIFKKSQGIRKIKIIIITIRIYHLKVSSNMH
jgi:hypothetical protein